MDFSEALKLVKAGEAIARKGWNAKDQYVYLVPANKYQAVTDVARLQFGNFVPYRAYLAIKTVQNDVVPWLASQSDLLAEDWLVVDL